MRPSALFTPQRPSRDEIEGIVGGCAIRVGQAPASAIKWGLREGSASQSPAPRLPRTTAPPSATESPEAARRFTRSGRQELSAVSPNHLSRPAPQPNEGARYGGVREWERDKSSPPNWRQVSSRSAAGASPHGRGDNTRRRRPSPSGNSPDEDRRRSQREKQVQFGYVTEGYANMERLIAHDPLLKSGGLLPLSPPPIVQGSKRCWDIQLRKWRRALHMFDYVFIDGEDDPATRARVLEEQRLQWVSEAFQETPREDRRRIDLDTLQRVQTLDTVPRTIPVEEDLRCILRRDDCYESVRSVVPQSASSLTKGTDISPLEAGIKIHIAPSAALLQRQQAQLEKQQNSNSPLQQLQQHHIDTNASIAAATAANLDDSAKPAASHRAAAPSPSPRRPELSTTVLPPSQAPPPSSSQRYELTPSQQRVRDVEPWSTALPQTRTEKAGTFSPVASGVSDGFALGLSVSPPHASLPSEPHRSIWGTLPDGCQGSAALNFASPPPFPLLTPGLWMPSTTGPATSEVPHIPLCCSQCGHSLGASAVAAPTMSSPMGAPTQGPPYGHFTNIAAGMGPMLPPSPSQLQQQQQWCSPVVCNAPTVPPFFFGGPIIPPAFYGQLPIGKAMMTSSLMPPPPGAHLAFTQGLPSHSRQGFLQPPGDGMGTSVGAAAVASRGRSHQRDSHPRSVSGVIGVAMGDSVTPKTAPRFVTRLSTSPSEQRLGERWANPHNGSNFSQPKAALEKEDASWQSPGKVEVAPSSPAVTEVAAATRREQSRSALLLSPDRVLFVRGAETEPTKLRSGAESVMYRLHHHQPSPSEKELAVVIADDDHAVIPLDFNEAA